MQSGELAKRTSLTVDAIRFYEKRRLLPKAVRYVPASFHTRFFSRFARLLWLGLRCSSCPSESHASAPRSERGRACEVLPDGVRKAPSAPFHPSESRKAILRGGRHPRAVAGHSRR
jgi:hypothetical protein